MTTDQQELAAYQRAVDAAKDEIAALRQRAELAEALALTLEKQRDLAEADTLALRDGICRYAEAAPEARGALYHRLFVLTVAEHPGAQLMTELAAARAVVAAARTGFGTEEDIQRAHAFDPNLLTARIRAYDEAMKEGEK